MPKTIIQEGEINVIVEINNGIINIGSRKIIPNHLNTLPTVIRENVIGRDLDIRKIGELLDRNERVTLLSGIGGIGKTTVAKAFLHECHSNYKHIAWLEVTGSIKEAFVFNSQLQDSLDIKRDELNLNKKDNNSINEAFEIIINRMRQLTGNNLLVIDNANEDIEHTQIFDYISLKPYWKVLVTSRHKFEGFADYEIGTLQPKFARELFYLHYKREVDDNILNEILELIGSHTLAVEVIAKTSEARRLRLADILERLKKKGLNISENADIKIRHNYNLKISKVFEYLVRVFEVAGLTEFDEWLLKQFSIMPPIPIPYSSGDGENLLFLLVKTKDDDRDKTTDSLNELVRKGWLNWDKTTDSFKMHQVIQEIILYRLQPDWHSCSSYISQLAGKAGMTNFIEGHRFIKYIEYLVRNLPLDSQNVGSSFRPHLQNVFLFFSDALHQHQKDELAQRCISYAKDLSADLTKQDDKFIIREADTYLNYGNVLLDQLNAEQAIALLNKALLLYEKSFEFSRDFKDNPSLIESNASKKDIHDAIEYATYGNSTKNIKTSIGNVYSGLGRGYHILNRYSDAESAFDNALQNLESQSHFRALSLLYYARLLKDQQNYSGAETTHQESVAISEKLTQKDSLKYSGILFHTYFEYGLFLNQFTGRERDTFTLYTRALETVRKITKLNPDMFNDQLIRVLISLSIFHIERIDQPQIAKGHALEAKKLLNSKNTNASMTNNALEMQQLDEILNFISKREKELGVSMIGDSETLIRKATNEGNYDLVNELIPSTNLDLPDTYGWTPLMYAVKKRHHNITKLLLQNGANCNARNKDGDSALIFAAQHNDVEMVSLLLTKTPETNIRSSEGRFPLGLAIANNNYNMAKLLLEAGSDPNQIGLKGYNPLILAIDISNIEIIRLLAQWGADLNHKLNGSVPLLLHSLQYGNLEVAKTLYNLGARIENNPDNLLALREMQSFLRSHGRYDLADLIDTWV